MAKGDDAIRLMVKNTFLKYDTDNSGFLETSELKCFFEDAMKESGGEPLTDRQLQTLIKELDENEDGKISFDELYTYMVPALSP